MPTRYFIEHDGLDDANHRVFIHNGGIGGGDFVIIPGNATLERGGSEDIYQPIQASSLNLDLTATTDEDLSDVWNEDDRYWSFIYAKDGVTILEGYLSNEDIDQPFNSVSWNIQVNGLDPLAYLEDLAYVDASFLPYTGLEKLIVIIANCLKRPFVDVNDAFNIYALTGLTTTSDTDFLENAYLDQSVFIKDDESQSCKEVLESILESLGCTIFQYNGAFYITSVKERIGMLFGSKTFNKYDKDGVSTGTEVFTSPSVDEREIKTASGAIFHVNGNQSYRTKKYHQSIRLKHTFEFKEQIIPNGEVITEGSGPYTLADWTLVVAETTIDDDVFFINGVELSASATLAATTDTVGLRRDDKIKITLDHEYIDAPTQQSLEIKIIGSSTTWYLRKIVGQTEAVWVNASSEFIISGVDGIDEGDFIHEIEPTPIPIDGDLEIRYLTGVFGAAHTGSSSTHVRSCTAELLDALEEGREFTIERTDKKTGQIPDVKEIRFSTSDRDALLNVFRDSSGDPISLFKGGGTTANSLNFLGITKLGVLQNNYYIFSGDVKGDVENIYPKRIIDLDAVYLESRLAKNTKTGVSNTEFVSVSPNSVATYTTEEKVIYRESVKPKIK